MNHISKESFLSVSDRKNGSKPALLKVRCYIWEPAPAPGGAAAVPPRGWDRSSINIHYRSEKK